LFLVFLAYKNRKMMEGISYLTNGEGVRTAIVIDWHLVEELEVNGMTLEDFFDVLAYRERKDEPKEDYMIFRQRLIDEGKLDVSGSHQ
jgi:hypothetical protein